MLVLVRVWSALTSGSSDFPGHPPQGEHLIWRCSLWISRQEVAVGQVLVRSDLFKRRWQSEYALSALGTVQFFRGKSE